MSIYEENFKRLLTNLCKKVPGGTTLSEDVKVRLDNIFKKLLSYILKSSDNIKSIKSSLKKILSSKLYNNAIDNCKVFSSISSLERVIKKYITNKDDINIKFISCVSYYIMYEIIDAASDITRRSSKTRITIEHIDSTINEDLEIKRIISKIDNKSIRKSRSRKRSRRSRSRR